MKIYVMTDLEGITGVSNFRQTREAGTPENLAAIRLMMGDIAAVAEGLRDGGAMEVYVLDCHGGGSNFLPEHMVPEVRYITGRQRGVPAWGLDSSFAGVVLLGYHAMNGTRDGVLHHTQSSLMESKYWYDGVERGEIFQSATLAGHYGVPVILVTGDEAACREARATLGEDLVTVAVKKGIHREAAVLIAAEETKEMLIQGAQRAMASLPTRKALQPTFPIEMRVRSLGPNGASLETPWYTERVCPVKCGLEIISGSAGRGTEG